MSRLGRTCPWIAAIGAEVLLISVAAQVSAQLGSTVPGTRFELSGAVQLDGIQSVVQAQVARVKVLLAERQWEEAVETLAQLTGSSEGKLIAAADQRYVSLREWCQGQLAALPAEGLKLYRARIDPIAQTWYEQGMAERNPALLQNVVEQAFASTCGGKAFWALGEMALEAGDYAAARRHWERVVPNMEPRPTNLRLVPVAALWDLDLAAVRARLVLASILEGSPGRAGEELAQFIRLHPRAEGRLGGREGKYADLLKALLTESTSWPAPPTDPDWLTVAGNPQRNGTAMRLVDVGAVAWRTSLRTTAASSARGTNVRVAGEDPLEPLSFHPVVVGSTVFVNDSQRILALRVQSGAPAWGHAAIYQSESSGMLSPSVSPEPVGSPRFTMTVLGKKLFARMGSPLTGQPTGASSATGPGYVVCLDLAAEGRLLWKFEPEQGWALEGSPLADAWGVYVAMRRQDVRPQAFVACLDADTGRLRWRRFICGADTPARGLYYESSHNLLTLSGRRLYYNTNLGAVAAVAADDGRLLWVSLYPRARRGDLAKLSPHWRRDLNPCVLDRGTLLVAPSDSPRIFALDAFSGQIIWTTGSEVEEVACLLGTAGEWLIASGGKLYWISLKEEDRGRVKRVWPDGPERPGYGRGLLAGGAVLWPTRDKLLIFDQLSGQPRKAVDLAARGAKGGNLLVADGRLLIATESELIAIGPYAGMEDTKQREPSFPRSALERTIYDALRHPGIAGSHAGVGTRW